MFQSQRARPVFRRARVVHTLVVIGLALLAFRGLPLSQADGVLEFSISEESIDQPTISRMELWRPDKQGRGESPVSGRAKARLGMSRIQQTRVRRTVPAGIGYVLDRKVSFELPDGPYQFRMIRGPEYRILSGNFALERDSLDHHHVALPRMVDMKAKGWLSGDCCALPSKNSLPLRMAAEDLHVVATAGEMSANPIPHRSKEDPIGYDPKWIRSDLSLDRGLAFYGILPDLDDHSPITANLVTVENDQVRVAIENPFAWQVPLWLATKQIDGLFLLGDWLRLDRTVLKVTDGPKVTSRMGPSPTLLGLHAERIYQHVLECGIRIAPMAGSGSDPGKTPIGYNRVYATTPQGHGYQDDGIEEPMVPGSPQQWWESVWQGHTMITNGPCLRATLGGKLPGYTFTSNGEAIRVQPEVQLAVRDPVDYLNVIHNGEIHYSARLDEFAKSGGRIPPLTLTESGWVMIRVATMYEGHYRVAFSAPWYVEFQGQPRVNPESVAYFQKWLRDYENQLKKLPKSELRQHVPLIQNARAFWDEKMESAR